MKRAVYALFLLTLLSSCVKEMPNSGLKPGEGNFNDFDFSTLTSTTLTVDYDTPAEVYFELYDKAPVRDNAEGTAYEKVEGSEPLYAGYTDAQGRFSAQLQLPAYLDKAYIYTPNVHAQTLLEAVKTGNALTASAVDGEAAVAVKSTRANEVYESAAVTDDNWKTWLGAYDNIFGRVTYEYKYSGEGTNLKEENWQELYTAANKVFDTSKACPDEFRSSSDLLLTEQAHVAVTFLMSNTCWNCSMGYYYYDESQTPKSLADIHPIMLFPNTQDGKWSNDPKKAAKYIGVERGTAVQLMYYPHIAEGSMEGATDIFPAGCRIGFILATNAWGNQLPGFKGAKKYRATTSEGLSVNDKGVAYGEARTAVYRYKNASLDLNSVICSFEDYTTDQNFSDIIFTVKSDPVEAVEVGPSVDEKPGEDDTQREVRLLKGIYAFEDLWPSRGDYDLNDVLVKLDYEKTVGNKGIYAESYLFKTFNNQAGLSNGLAFTLEGDAASTELECSILRPVSKDNPTPEYETFTMQRDGNTYLLTDNVKDDMGATYKVTATYTKPIDEKRAAVIKPFVYRTSDEGIAPGKRWEVHLPFEAPTDKMDVSYFGKGDDKSIPGKGVYYVRAENYPFAIFLAGATEANLAKLLDPVNEKTAIDKLYPGYAGWAASKGENNKDWYK